MSTPTSSARRRIRGALLRRFTAWTEQVPLNQTTGSLTRGRGVLNWRAIEWEGDNRIGHYSTVNAGGTVGYGSRFAGGCQLIGPIQVGRYCSIAGGVSFVTGPHPIATAATFSSDELFGGRRKDLLPPRGSVVGNDVWIGQDVTVVDGVRIGDGAVVAAGAVVVDDVEPFDVVGGVPARVIRPRFTPAVRDLVARLAWWELTPEQLTGFEEVLALDLTVDEPAAIAALEQAIRQRDQLGRTGT